MVKKIILIVFFVSLISGAGVYYLFLTKKTPVGGDRIGVSDKEILIGSSLALTGHTGFLGTEYLSGGQAYINKINDEGGLYGRKIKLISYDDQYDPAQCVVNTQKLIREDKVFALFNYVGTPTGTKILPIIEEAEIPLLGLFSGADIFRDPVKKYVFNVRASYYQETSAFIKGVVGELGMNKVAVFYQNDAYGLDGLKGAEIALSEYNLAPTATASYDRGSLNVENALETIKKAQPQAVIMIGTYGPCAKFIKLARSQGFNPVFHNVSFVGSEVFVKELGDKGNGVVLTEVVPPLTSKNLLIGINSYTDYLAKYFPGHEPSLEGLEGFINAQILVEGLKRAGQDLTRQKFIEALESIQQYSLSIASPVNFSPEHHQGMELVYLVYIKDGQFHLFFNWADVKSIITGQQ